MRYNRALCWIRRDLRLNDQTALAAACAAAAEVIVVFIFDTTILKRLNDRNDRRITFIHRSLHELNEELRRRGSALLVRHGDPHREIPALAAALGTEALFFNRDYEPGAVRRDDKISQMIRAQGGDARSFKDHVIYEREEIMTKSGTPFKVFTPYKNAWLDRLAAEERAILKERTPDLNRLAPAAALAPHEEPWTMDRIGFVENELWLEPGQRAAERRMTEFMERIGDYDTARNYPAESGTSGLSAHLRFGTISTRECVRRARSAKGSGGSAWLNELIWRDFYHMVLDRFPHVVDGAFKPEYDGIVWQGTEERLAAWQEGRTGYPIVDAAMRLFNRTGWMHNRLRMVTASFLTKDLLVSRQSGEAYFARYLLDFDLAANNGGWQWSASTGCDAQPYFRIFNPVSQSEKFDPHGKFIREHCPELAGFSNRRIHWPAGADMFEQQSAGCIIGKDYPAPIVDHAVQRELALKMFRDIG